MHRAGPGDRRRDRAGLTLDDPVDLVRVGYDAIAARYEVWARDEIVGSPAVAWTRKLQGLLSPRADVVELGCGNGEPVGRMLAEAYRYTGVDISPAQLERARTTVRDGTFVEADITQLGLPSRSADAVVALYTLNHVPRELLPTVFRRIAEWLRPGGYLLATTGRSDTEAFVDPDWLGAPMFFSSWNEATNLRLLADAGFDVLEHEVICQQEGEQGEACFLWVLARRPPDLQG